MRQCALSARISASWRRTAVSSRSPASSTWDLARRRRRNGRKMPPPEATNDLLFRAAVSPERHSTLNLYLAELLCLLKKRKAGRATTRGKIGGGLRHASV